MRHYRKKSDIDLAFDFKESDNWDKFRLWVDDELGTLREVDLVDMSSASKDILKSIEAEGRLIYERENR